MSGSERRCSQPFPANVLGAVVRVRGQRYVLEFGPGDERAFTFGSAVHADIRVACPDVAPTQFFLERSDAEILIVPGYGNAELSLDGLPITKPTSLGRECHVQVGTMGVSIEVFSRSSAKGSKSTVVWAPRLERGSGSSDSRSDERSKSARRAVELVDDEVETLLALPHVLSDVPDASPHRLVQVDVAEAEPPILPPSEVDDEAMTRVALGFSVAPRLPVASSFKAGARARPLRRERRFGERTVAWTQQERLRLGFPPARNPSSVASSVEAKSGGSARATREIPCATEENLQLRSRSTRGGDTARCVPSLSAEGRPPRHSRCAQTDRCSGNPGAMPETLLESPELAAARLEAVHGDENGMLTSAQSADGARALAAPGWCDGDAIVPRDTARKPTNGRLQGVKRWRGRTLMGAAGERSRSVRTWLKARPQVAWAASLGLATGIGLVTVVALAPFGFQGGGKALTAQAHPGPQSSTKVAPHGGPPVALLRVRDVVDTAVARALVGESGPGVAAPASAASASQDDAAVAGQLPIESRQVASPAAQGEEPEVISALALRELLVGHYAEAAERYLRATKRCPRCKAQRTLAQLMKRATDPKCGGELQQRPRYCPEVQR